MMGLTKIPTNPLTAMRKCATLMLKAYQMKQLPEYTNAEIETVILEAIDMAKHAIRMLRSHDDGT